MKKIAKITKTAALIAGFCALAIIPEPCSAERMEKGDTIRTTTEKRGNPNTLDLNETGKNMDTARQHLPPVGGAIENSAQLKPANENGHRFGDLKGKQLYDLAELEVIYAIGSERRN